MRTVVVHFTDKNTSPPAPLCAADRFLMWTTKREQVTCADCFANLAGAVQQSDATVIEGDWFGRAKR